jgi:hypothetical protein
MAEESENKMTDNDNEDIDKQIEMATLLPDRWYVIFQNNKHDDNVTMSAYDTTSGPQEDGYYDSGTVIQNGIIELLENDFERIVEAGMARLSFKQLEEEIISEVNEELGISIDERGDNIIKVDFGAKQ